MAFASTQSTYPLVPLLRESAVINSSENKFKCTNKIHQLYLMFGTNILFWIYIKIIFEYNFEYILLNIFLFIIIEYIFESNFLLNVNV